MTCLFFFYRVGICQSKNKQSYLFIRVHALEHIYVGMYVHICVRIYISGQEYMFHECICVYESVNV